MQIQKYANSITNLSQLSIKLNKDQVAEGVNGYNRHSNRCRSSNWNHEAEGLK